MVQTQLLRIAEESEMGELTRRWGPLRPHATQERLVRSSARFNVVPAGRRSGKTEIVGKRKLVMAALNAHRKDLPYFYREWPDPRFFAAAPTRDQVKRIYWEDLKALIPTRYVVGKPNESQLMIPIVNGAQIWCLGMDKPERAEGVPWDGGVLDEYGNMKKDVWPNHVRASLSDRRGWCDFIGVPEGRNHYYDLAKSAQARCEHALKQGKQPEWDYFHWISADILPADEIAAAREDLDELTYQQEYEASFVNFTGRAYWAFTEDNNVGRLEYNPGLRLDFCFDFNVDPGVAMVVQEQWLPQKVSGKEPEWGDGVVGEVYIPRGSNTIRVADKLIADWGEHESSIYCYGDFTGGARGSASVLGSDWELIKGKLWNHFGRDRVFFRIRPNPRERDRLNSVNSRCLSLSKKIRLVVDPSRAPHTVKDFEGVTLIEGGTGEIDKKTAPELTHLTDAYGYRVWYEYPVKRKYETTGQRYIR
ncbi:hypothetical protein LCGC14_0790990 [marine sediment metagenome]|uniref:Terminase large subunit gp17-like C-terminal domain-containing protein n=1 Tax=marine sediment metagenome TaxID=412755 RepID=A0A0F9QCD1_9ZZZZ